MVAKLQIRDRSGRLLNEVDFDDLYLQFGNYTDMYVSDRWFQFFIEQRRILKASLDGLNLVEASGNMRYRSVGFEPEDHVQGFYSYEHQKRMHEILLRALTYAMD